MLKVYLTSRDIINKAYQGLGDPFFDTSCMNKGLIEKHRGEISKLIKSIDDGRYIGNEMYVGKFSSQELDLTKLSTGCKIAISILLYPETVFNTIECGYNAIDEIFKFNDGNIYLPIKDIYSIEKPIEVIANGKSTIVNDTEQFLKITKGVKPEYESCPVSSKQIRV